MDIESVPMVSHPILKESLLSSFLSPFSISHISKPSLSMFTDTLSVINDHFEAVYVSKLIEILSMVIDPNWYQWSF